MPIFLRRASWATGSKNGGDIMCRASAPAYFVVGFTAGAGVSGGISGDAAKDNAAVDAIFSAIGKDRAWFDKKVLAGKTNWTLDGANGWGWYNVFIQSCQDFAESIRQIYQPPNAILQWGPLD